MILVIGGAGYIGSHAVLALKEAGYEVAILDNLSRGHADLAFGDHFIEGDLRNPEDLERTFQRFQIDGVVHFAASSLVGESMKCPEAYYYNNVLGSLNLLKAMRIHDVRTLVFSSTAAVYGEPENIPIEETDKKEQTNVYGETKYFIESMLRGYHRAYGLNSIALRYFNAAGADPLVRTGEDHTPETHLVPLILDVAMGKREKIQIFGNDYPTSDGTCLRDYVHVTDLASAHVLALQRLLEGKATAEAYNLGNGNGYSVLEVIEQVRKVTGHAIPAELSKRRSGDPAILVASSKLAETTLGWKKEHSSLEEIVGTAWKWHQKRFDSTQ